MIFLLKISLLITTWLKLHSHWNYYKQIHNLDEDVEFKDFMYESISKENSIWNAFFIMLKFLAPVFIREFPDLKETEYQASKKNILKWILIWWAIAIGILVLSVIGNSG
ncbi:MAG: hypothetical protein HEP71_30605 [Roseivirga sp.]|nr:hypothetical protein [Roseivirga sp.]